MNLAVVNVEARLNILQGQIYVACRLGAWCFSEAQKLYFSTAPNQDIYYDLLKSDQCLAYAYRNIEPEARPHIISGALGLAWVSEWVHLRQGGRFLVILGPVYLHRDSVEFSLQQLEQTGLTQQEYRRYLNALNDVPTLELHVLRQYAGILHFTIYELGVDSGSVLPEFSEGNVPSLTANQQFQEDTSALTTDFQRIAECEKRLLDTLGKSGDLSLDARTYRGKLQDFHLRDLLRQVKNNTIIFTALCTRNAIAAGVPLYTAKTMESDWVCKIEQSRSPAETEKLFRGMYSAFSHEIQNHSKCIGLSKAVRECRDYICMNYTRELKLEELAKQVGYAEYYLTRKFYRETGEKLTDYIRSVRIDAAKALLITSKRDIQSISEELQFGSRSYFDRVFRQKVGISPAKYREAAGYYDNIPHDEGQTQPERKIVEDENRR